MSGQNINGSASISSDVYRISQTASANEFVSVKVLATNGRVSGATFAQPSTGEFQANVTIGGQQRRVTFYETGAHALIQ